MILRSILPFVATFFFLALPAHAGLRAVYGSAEENKTLVIEVADTGDVRIAESGDTSFGLLLSGQFYVVSRQQDQWMAARTVDVAAAIDKAMPPIFGDALIQDGPPRPVVKLEMARKGERAVGGRKGTVWTISGFGGAQGQAVEYVMSADEDLKPVGRALEQFMHAAIIPGAPLMGSAAAEFIEETRAIFALGTPIDVGGRFQLRYVEKAELNHERFELPVRPSTVDELLAAMPKAAK